MYDNLPICAISTGNVNAPIAIIRISGENILDLLSGNIKLKKRHRNVEAQRVYYSEFIDDNGNFIDDIIFIFFKSPHSYTGEDVIEIHCHGSYYIKQAILRTLFSKGIRYANPGEFTLRAYLNKKIDLSQAEAINDLIQSENEKAHNIVFRQYKGNISSLISDLRKQITELLVYLELELDFSEEDVEFASRKKIKELLDSLHSYIEKLTISYAYGNAVKKGILVSILGNPNAGKSTLMNSLLKEDRSIVTDIPGTTRDIVEDYFNYKGLTFRFADTAGLRKTTEIVEQYGIEKAINKAKESFILLYLFDPTQQIDEQINVFNNLLLNVTQKQKIILLINKIDKVTEKTLNEVEGLIKKIYSTYRIIPISAKHNVNISLLLDVMYELVESMNLTGNDCIITNERHYNLFIKASECLSNAYEALEKNLSADLLAEELKMINYYLSEITGEVTNTEVLHEIFSRFCIGK
ncbi:MAG: tRNA uridine-5-carboxymethylaminomethyl(34) synthesis GTPase MnmE [Bacteroidales bacterium]|nr:tRNA uridine-5-carboxymethylaminomethyl(34) synthesis GTPase MnmE [Bacteroidales bacterium]